MSRRHSEAQQGKRDIFPCEPCGKEYLTEGECVEHMRFVLDPTAGKQITHKLRAATATIHLPFHRHSEAWSFQSMSSLLFLTYDKGLTSPRSTKVRGQPSFRSQLALSSYPIVHIIHFVWYIGRVLKSHPSQEVISQRRPVVHYNHTE